MCSLFKNEKWLVPIGGNGAYLCIKGWYPTAFDWDIRQIHKQQAQLRKMKLVLGLRPGFTHGGHPAMLFDQLPIPMFASDNHVIKSFSSYWDGFCATPVRSGIVQNNKFKLYTKSLLLVPLPEVFFFNAR